MFIKVFGVWQMIRTTTTPVNNPVMAWSRLKIFLQLYFGVLSENNIFFSHQFVFTHLFKVEMLLCRLVAAFIVLIILQQCINQRIGWG